MASFQVEMAAASSSPFGCVLRDRNRCSNRETSTAASAASSTASSTTSSKAAAAAFQKNLKVLVRDHLHTCISVSPDENENVPDTSSTRPASSKTESTRNNNNNNNSNSNNINSRMSSRQARNLDRWAAKQAEQMVSTIERQRQEAEELWVVASSNPSNCSKKETENRVISSQSSIADSECSSQIGASSLVQIWEARMNHPKPKPHHSRSSSISSLDNLVEEPARHSDVCLDTVSNNDLLTEWVDSEAQSTVSAPVPNRHSDVGADGEKVRIADIIRRLTCEVHEHHNQHHHHSYQHHDSGNVHCDTPRRHSISSEPAEHRGGWSLCVSSPRIRGRQAFHDLLLHIEQDRHKELGSLAERHAVSKFCYRGRIQSLLKLRFLRRDMGVQSRPVPPPPACRPPQHSSSIMQLRIGKRERLRASLLQEREPVVAAPIRLENHTRKVENNTCSIQNQPKENVPPMEEQCPVVVAANVEQQTEAVSVCPQGSPVLDKKETGERVEDVVGNHHVKEEQSNTVTETSENNPFQDSVDAWQERYLDCAMGDEAEPEEEGDGEGEEEEEEECDEEQQDYVEEAPYDWFSDIARPRSYWEDMRRSWYDEMLNNGNGNRDIKELLERQTVSSFLASDFRDRIDRLMMSRARIQATQEQQPESDVEENQEKMAQLALSYFRRENNDGSQEQHPMVDDDRGEIEETDEGTEDESSPSSSKEEEEDEEEEESEEYIEQEEHREESLTSRQFVEANDLFDRSSHQSSLFTASPFRPWQSVEEYERFSHANSQQHHQSFQGSHNQERKCSCCGIHASIDVDVVNELRGNVAELRSEVAELKKLVQSCMEMQMTLAKLQQQPGEVGTWRSFQ
ncbi:hypothetical protein LINGRAPRIM_LOCUS1015 [Linum grandiflorum]